MATPHKQSSRRRIHASYCEDIRSGRLKTGAKLPSIRNEAERFGTSPGTIQQVYNLLESEGYIEKHHGCGCFVRERLPHLSMSDAVLLSMQTRGHLFGELYAGVSSKLQAQGRLCMTINALQEEHDRHFLERMARSGARILVVQGQPGFDYERLYHPPLHDVTKIYLLTRPPSRYLRRAHYILVDHTRGADAAAEFLWQRGHQHVLVVGPENMLREMSRPDAVQRPDCISFSASWERLGGRYSTLAARDRNEWGAQRTDPPATTCHYDEEELWRLLRAPDGPTAVMGLMDASVAEVQRVLREGDATLSSRIELLGYGDTPWSRHALRPFASVSWNLDGLSDAIANTVQLCASIPPEAPIQIHVPPLLVRRDSVPAIAPLPQ